MTISNRLYANNAKTTLFADIASTDTTLQVINGSNFPTPSTGQDFLVTLESGNFIEVIRVTGRTGNYLTGCTRGYDGTTPLAFQAGTKVENRVTKGTLDRFERVVNVLSELDSVDNLNIPVNSNSTTYICHSNDPSGNPVLAIRNSDNKWKFNTHMLTAASGSVTSGTTLGLTSDSIGSSLSGLTSGKYILQFTSGANVGLCRMLTQTYLNGVGWLTDLPAPPAPADTFEIYMSTSAALSGISGNDDSIIFSIIFS